MVNKSSLGNKKRILAVVGAIPCRNNVYAGIFTMNQIIELSKTDKYKIDIVFMRPMFPKLTSRIMRSMKKNISILDRPIDPIEQGIDIHLVPYLYLPKLSTIMMILTAYSYILSKGLEFDVIHSYFLFFPGYLGIKLGGLFKKPVVVTAMGSDVNVVFDRCVHGRIVNAGIIRRIVVTLQKADLIVAKSEYLRRKITQLGIPGKKVWVIKNGVSREKFRLLDTESSALDGERKTILYVGSLFVEKGLRELVKAVEILSKKRSDFSLAVIGDGPFKREFIDLVRRLRIGEFVKIEGQKDHEEIPGWMSNSYVLCLPSYNEGLPNVVLESISCGRPVVASNVGGIPEIINDSELGILVPPRSPEKLAEALEEALDKEWNHEAIAKSGARFHWENILSRFNELYSELI